MHALHQQDLRAVHARNIAAAAGASACLSPVSALSRPPSRLDEHCALQGPSFWAGLPLPSALPGPPAQLQHVGLACPPLACRHVVGLRASAARGWRIRPGGQLGTSGRQGCTPPCSAWVRRCDAGRPAKPCSPGCAWSWTTRAGLRTPLGVARPRLASCSRSWATVCCAGPFAGSGAQWLLNSCARGFWSDSQLSSDTLAQRPSSGGRAGTVLPPACTAERMQELLSVRALGATSAPCAACRPLWPWLGPGAALCASCRGWHLSHAYTVRAASVHVRTGLRQRPQVAWL